MSDLVSSDEFNSLSLSGGVKMPDEELKEWQMILITSADAKKRQEAFRRIMLSQLDVNAKRAYCFQVLGEAHDELKRDAFKALASLGGDSDLLQCLEDILHTRSGVRVRAIKQLPQLLSDDDSSSWVLGYLIKGVLEYEEDQLVLKEFYLILREVNKLIRLEQLSDLVKVLLICPEALQRLAREVLLGWAEDEERGLALLDEARIHGRGPAAEWLLPLAFSTGLRSDDLRDAMVEQLLTHTGSLDPTGIGNLLIQLGEPCLRPLMADFDNCERPIYTLFVMSQIVVQHQVKKVVLGELLDFILDQLRSGSRDVLPTLLGFPLGGLDLPAGYREKWIKELIYSRNQLSSEHLLNEADYQIISAGEAAVPTLKKIFKSGDDSDEQLYALSLLVKVLPDETKELELCADEINQKIDKNSLDRGDLIKALGHLWAREAYPAERRNTEVELCLQSLWRKSRTPERFEAMAKGLPKMNGPMANRVIFALVDLLETKLPELEKQSLKRKVDIIDGAQLEHELLMAGLNGLIGALSRDDVLPEIFEQIKKLLYVFWQREIGEEITLGPGAMPGLVKSFVVLIHHHEKERAEALTLILAQLERPSVMKSLVQIWSFLSLEEIEKVARHLMAQYKIIRQLEFEEVSSLLEVTDCLLREKTAETEDLAERVLSRLKGLKRYHFKQVDAFLESH